MDCLLQPGALTPMFQPIFDLGAPRSTIHHLECLSRGPQGTHFHSAEVLFEYGRRAGETEALDRAAITAQLEAAGSAGFDCALSLNVHATTIESADDFGTFLSGLALRQGLAVDRFMIEIVEHLSRAVSRALLDRLASLRELGVAIALDDLGFAQSGFRLILDCAPDYLKMDKYFVQGCHGDPRRQAILQSVVWLGRRLGARLIAEGVENEQDLEMVRALGFGLAQGFFLSPPLGAEAMRKLLSVSAVLE
jgi:EAL domain-containing protein (putative c-di-GMP-specific phosphodiesterase class I)